MRKLTAHGGPFAHLREAALVVGLCLGYAVVNGLVGDARDAAAVDNAQKLIAFEQALGVFHEVSWNRWAVGLGDWTIVAFNWLYILTFLTVMPAVAIACYVFNRDAYYRYRALILLTLFMAAGVYLAFPVAPPRAMAEFGLVDTLKVFGPAWYDNRDAVGYFNVNAALPSLHFAWSLIFGALIFGWGGWVGRVAGVVYPVVTFVAIVVTANHYFVDAAAGAALVALAWGIRKIPSLFSPPSLPPRRGKVRRGGDWGEVAKGAGEEAPPSCHSEERSDERISLPDTCKFLVRDSHVAPQCRCSSE